MRATPATWDEADTWLTVLVQHGHLHHVEAGPDGIWAVHRTPDGLPWTLHHPVLALDYIAEVLLGVRTPNAEDHR